MLIVHMQVGGQKALFSSNPENALDLPAPTAPGTDIGWSEDLGGIVSQQRLNSGQQCKYTAVAPGTVTATITGLSIGGVTVTKQVQMIVDPPPVNELTHFEPTVEMVD